MTQIQQEVLIYKEKAFATAQNQFERDLKKRQQENWRLISVTPTEKKGFGRITRLTAIYERAIEEDDDSLPEDLDNEEAEETASMPNSAKSNATIWEKIKEKERVYQSTLSPEQLRRRKRRNILIGSITLLVVLILCITATSAVANNPAIQQGMVDAELTAVTTDTPVPPTPTPTPIALTSHQGIEKYTTNLINQMSPTLYGQLVGVAYTSQTKELQVLFYIPSSQVWDNNNMKNMIEINCFDVQQAIWTSRLKGVIGKAVVHIQGDLVDAYGNTSKGEVGTATLVAATAKRFNWANLAFSDAWDNQDYDSQWMLPSVANS